TVTTTIVSPDLVVTKSINPATSLHPNQLVTFDVDVQNTGGAAASNVTIGDPLAGSNTTYVAGTMQWSLDGGAFTALTDAADVDAGTLSGTTLQFTLASLGAGQDVTFRFQATVNAGTGGLFASNQA